MSTPTTGRLLTVPLRRVIGELRRAGPLGLVDRVGEQSQGALTRLSLRPFQPLLVTYPDHLRHVLRDREANYVRGAAMWKALGRLTAQGITGQGPQWQASTDILRKALSGRYVCETADQVTSSVVAAVEDLERRAAGRPVDGVVEMTRIVHRVINPVFFGSRIPQDQ
jgi:cytochrome P450